MNLSNYTREFGTNLKLAYPVIVGMLGHTVVQLIDNIMVGQLGTAELAAVSLGNSFVFVAMSLGIGFSTAITPMIAESFGAKNHNKVRYIFVHGLILCFGLGVVLASLVLWAQPLLSGSRHSRAISIPGLFGLTRFGSPLHDHRSWV